MEYYNKPLSLVINYSVCSVFSVVKNSSLRLSGFAVKALNCT